MLGNLNHDLFVFRLKAAYSPNSFLSIAMVQISGLAFISHAFFATTVSHPSPKLNPNLPYLNEVGPTIAQSRTKAPGTLHWIMPLGFNQRTSKNQISKMSKISSKIIRESSNIIEKFGWWTGAGLLDLVLRWRPLCTCWLWLGGWPAKTSSAQGCTLRLIFTHFFCAWMSQWLFAAWCFLRPLDAICCGCFIKAPKPFLSLWVYVEWPMWLMSFAWRWAKPSQRTANMTYFFALLQRPVSNASWFWGFFGQVLVAWSFRIFRATTRMAMSHLRILIPSWCLLGLLFIRLICRTLHHGKWTPLNFGSMGSFEVHKSPWLCLCSCHMSMSNLFSAWWV